MRQISLRLVQRGDGETDRHGALSEAGDLGKDEPHPVALLPPGLQLPTHLLVNRSLGVHETLEVERDPPCALSWEGPLRTTFHG